MPVYFTKPGNSTEQLRPAPLVTLQRTTERDEKGDIINKPWIITLSGTIVNVGTTQDSPDAQSHGFGDMNDITAEINRIRNIFDADGGRLELVTPDGGPNNLDAYVFIDDLSFDSTSNWTVRVGYQVRLRTYALLPEDEEFTDVTNTTDNWEITENPDSTFTVVHTLAAIGLKTFGPSGASDPMDAAKDWCHNRMYTPSNGDITANVYSGHPSGSLLPVSGLTGYWNLGRVETVGYYQNSWQVVENFIHLPSGNAREEFSVSVNYAPNNPYKVFLNLQGTVIGYSDKDSENSTKTTRAKSYFEDTVVPNLYNRANTYKPDGFSVNTTPNERQVTYQNTNGILSYSYGYFASSGTLIPDALDENISITDTGQNDVVAQIPVPGRAAGPVVQAQLTKTLPERTVSISATLIKPPVNNLTLGSLYSLYAQRPDTDNIVNAFKPDKGKYYITQDSVEWNPVLGVYSRTSSWLLNPEGVSVSGVPTGMANNP